MFDRLCAQVIVHHSIDQKFQSPHCKVIKDKTKAKDTKFGFKAKAHITGYESKPIRV